jgi:hypothetical protein
MALATLASAIAAKGQRDGQTAYISAFANPSTDVSGFTTQFDADVARAFVSQGGVVPTWTYNLERDFYSSFLRVSSDGYLMRWEVYQGHGGDEGDPEAGDSTLHRRYRVFTLDADNNIGPLIALGIADLAFKRIAPSRWVIVQWDDQVDRTGGDAGANAALSFSKRRLESLSQ